MINVKISSLTSFKAECMVVKSNVELKGFKSSEKCRALVDTGAAMTVIDKSLAEVLGVMYTGRERLLTSATGHKLKGEIAMVREMIVEDEILDYEKVLVVEFNEEVKKTLNSLNVHPLIIVGITTVELASLIPDITTGTLKKANAFLF
ncbi:retroviral-like aspartic protease family protein [Candidatus Bathyarchaeota archaeon]|nr:retroviral-like aspartic protease family protein [Candidatus Bathyarchaeota archaeon]MBS7618199.1 retroviral-like aspartic protease family protein [Candidatus Bathyarchaeota archaeon]